MFNPSSKPKIRTRTVQVAVKKAPQPAAQNQGSNGATKPPASRYSLTPSTKARVPTSSSQPKTASRAPQRAPQRKRKVATQAAPDFASSSEDSSEDETEAQKLAPGARKRQKTSNSIEPPIVNRCLEPDLKRRIRIQEQADGAEKEAVSTEGNENTHEKLVHGVHMSRGVWARDFKTAFPGLEKNLVVKLQYPSASSPEKFEAVIPNDDTNFNPVHDIYFSIEEMIHHYLPQDLSIELLSEITGPVRLLKRAVAKNSPDDFVSALAYFNQLIKDKVADGTIAKVLDDTHAIPLSLTRRITAQVYQRTVSPYAHTLRKVTNKETTYGELLPQFIHTIFHQTGLNSSQTFVDLGSGVGNVVLQSALQTGAESWGIELMEKPAKVAVAQASELRARAKLWNISLGPIHLLHGSFFESPEVDAVLQRADVVLVNNKVFNQATNSNILNKFLDLKTGCKVVSLVSFGGGSSTKHGIRNEQSIANLFDEDRFESGTDSVSWAGESVEYFIATKTR